MTLREITRASESYPARLLDLRDAPDPLWLEGALPRGPTVAIVGTRRASPDALTFTERIARELTEAGAVVVSGGAVGIDAAAHAGALLAGGRTVVVQAASLLAPYPRRHRALFARVLEHDGAWISETPPGAPTEPWRFLARNRIIAALAEVVIVVQAPARSGALSTAGFATTLGRPVFGVPGAPWDPRAEGVLGLLAHGASICTRAASILPHLGIPQLTLPLSVERSAPAREPDRVYEALARDGACHVDELVRRTGLAAARIQVALIELSMAGRARHDAGVWRAT